MRTLEAEHGELGSRQCGRAEGVNLPAVLGPHSECVPEELVAKGHVLDGGFRRHLQVE